VTEEAKKSGFRILGEANRLLSGEVPREDSKDKGGSTWATSKNRSTDGRKAERAPSRKTGKALNESGCVVHGKRIGGRATVGAAVKGRRAEKIQGQCTHEVQLWKVENGDGKFGGKKKLRKKTKEGQSRTGTLCRENVILAGGGEE